MPRSLYEAIKLRARLVFRYWVQYRAQLKFFKSQLPLNKRLVGQEIILAWDNQADHFKDEMDILRRHLEGIEKCREILLTNHPIKLELGSGVDFNRAGWYSVDIQEGVDITLDLRRGLPFPNESVDEIHSEHLMEHFDRGTVQHIFSECFRVLKVGGKISASVPDAGRALKLYAEGETAFYGKKFWCDPEPNWCKTPMDDINWLFYMGGQHAFMFDKQNLPIMLREAGFERVKIRAFDPLLDNPDRQHQSLYIEGQKVKKYSEIARLQDITKSNDRDAYDNLWGDEVYREQYVNGDRLSAWRRICTLCRNYPGPILDIGCGNGYLLKIFRALRPNEELWGIDISEKSIECAAQVVQDAHLLVCDASRMEQFECNQFPIIVCSEVLEHVDNPTLVLNEIHRILSEDGRLVVSIPDGDIDTFEGHRNFWNEESFRHFALQNNLKVIHT
ncbi:MAG: methyltransferase domain-containing protein [Actinomycetota bacterium]|nr:methyltransferase domain-containing protein [Actinomycetota bacterium]